MILNVFTDGGSRGNPGISGYGVVIKADSKTIYRESKSLGIKTNNEAEYYALISAIKWIVQEHPTAEKIVFHSDSELVIRQVTGIYKMKALNLKPLLQQVHSLLSQLSLPYDFKIIPRELNVDADKLANQAMNKL
ncbi:MAG: ribonuclease HI family protein [Candidatus Shapirobacteria bacterium]|nr:ribonuclease HI family protein [Candidatus Shapirobacteria bacterium]